MPHVAHAAADSGAGEPADTRAAAADSTAAALAQRTAEVRIAVAPVVRSAPAAVEGATAAIAGELPRDRHAVSAAGAERPLLPLHALRNTGNLSSKEERRVRIAGISS